MPEDKRRIHSANDEADNGSEEDEEDPTEEEGKSEKSEGVGDHQFILLFPSFVGIGGEASGIPKCFLISSTWLVNARKESRERQKLPLA